MIEILNNIKLIKFLEKNHTDGVYTQFDEFSKFLDYSYDNNFSNIDMFIVIFIIFDRIQSNGHELRRELNKYKTVSKFLNVFRKIIENDLYYNIP